MEYSKKKELKPLETVKKIKETLNNLGLQTKVSFAGGTPQADDDRSLYSCRIFIDNPFIGQNGKGTTPEYTRASGYAELMERLQNWCIFNLKFPLPDLEQIPQNKFIEKNSDFVNEEFFKCLYKGIKRNEIEQNLKTEDMIKFIQKYLKNDENSDVDCVKFYSVKDQKSVYVPYNPITRITNGMCAGNTPEEAIVQGLSEVFERYVAQEILIKNYTCPFIPKKEYEQYEEIQKMIKLYEDMGFTIQIRDASLGKKYHVVCVVLIDQETSRYTVKFGSHPSMPIAIERCLTEIAQGFELSKDALLMDSTFNQLTPEIDIFCMKMAELKRMLHLTRYPFSSSFFLDQPTWEWDKDAWMNTELSNKEILGRITDIIHNQSYDIYIRDASYLGFPSYHIIVPQMTILRDEIVCYENIEKVSNMTMPSEFKDFRLSQSYITVAYFLIKKDYHNALDFLDKAIQENGYSPKDKRRFSHEELECLKQYINHKTHNYTDQEIKSLLNLFYGQELTQKVFSKWVESDPMSNWTLSEDEIEIRDSLNKVAEKLLVAYKKNIPNQNELIEVFNTKTNSIKSFV